MYDGDLVLVLDNKTMMKGVDRNATITIDIDDKVCALVEADTPQNRTACIIRSLKSRIGEISNFASAYSQFTDTFLASKASCPDSKPPSSPSRLMCLIVELLKVLLIWERPRLISRTD